METIQDRQDRKSRSRSKDLMGQRYGRLTVIAPSDEPTLTASGAYRKKWVCRCDCGEVVTVYAHNLRRGFTRSCGCLRSEKSRLNAQKAREQKKRRSE